MIMMKKLVRLFVSQQDKVLRVADEIEYYSVPSEVANADACNNPDKLETFKERLRCGLKLDPQAVLGIVWLLQKRIKEVNDLRNKS
jgi:hypothetical protein